MSNAHNSESEKPGQHPVKRASLIRKCLFVTLAFLFVLLILASLLLFTHTGNTLLWRQLSSSLPALDGELTEGQLMTGWSIRNLQWKGQWEDNQVSFQASEVTLEWQLETLFTTLFTSRELPVARVEVNSASLDIQPVAGATQQPAFTITDSAPNPPLNIPLDILIHRINIQNLTVASSGTNLTLDSLEAKARLLNNQLTIPEVRADRLKIQRPAQKSQSTNKTPSGNTPQSEPAVADLSKITLPEITLPLAIKLEQFTLTHVEYQQDDIKETINRVDLSFDWQSTEIQNLRLNIEQTRANALLTGNIQLTEKYPLTMDLNATVLDDFGIPELSALKGEKISLKASGDLSKLQLTLATEGAINTVITGSVGPLAPEMPLSLTAKWPELQWPLQAESPQISASSGAIQIAGNLTDYRLSLNTSVKIAAQPATAVTLTSSGNLEHLNISMLSLRPVNKEQPTEASAETLKLQGNLNWKHGIHWQGLVRVVQLNPDAWLPNIPGTLNGRVKTGFSINNNQWQLSIPELNITGSLLNNPLKMTGKIEASNQVRPVAALPYSINVQNFSASLGANHLNINGQIAEQLSLNAMLDAKALDAINPNLSGSVQGHLQLTGNHEHPTLSFGFDSPSMNFRQTNVTQLQVNGALTKTTRPQGSGLEGKTSVEVGALNNGNLQLEQLAITASGSERNHQISLKTRGEPVSGELLINGVWHSASEKRPHAPPHSEKKGQWQGLLAKARIVTPVANWFLEKPVVMSLNSSAEVRLSDQCWQAKPARLCIEASQFSASQGATRLQLSDFDLATLTPFLPENLTWKAILSGNGYIQWDGGHPMAHFQIQTTPGEVSSDSENPLSIKYQQLSTVINLTEDNLVTRFDFTSRQLGATHVKLAINNMQGDQRLSGQANLQNLHLYFLQPLIPNIKDINGVLSANTRLGGTLKAPLLFGSLKLTEGQMLAKREMVKVSNLVTVLNVDGNKGEISGNMQVGDGEMTLSGHLDWQQMPLSGVIEMKGKNLQAKVPGVLQLKASPDLKLTLGEGQTLTGKITIPWARVRIKQLPKQAVTPSDDVVIITRGSETALMQAGPPFSMKVNVVLGKDIKINAYGLKSDLDGRLRLDLQPGKPMVADGAIQLVNGRYHQFGQDLLIKEGNIIFSGPLSSPYLSVDAIRNPESIEDDVSVGIQVSGSPVRPEFAIHSDPLMPQQEQWSYLLRGRGLEDGDSSAVQSMLIGFGVSQLGGVATIIGEKIGLTDVTLDTKGSGDDTQVTIGGTIAPGLRIQYGAGVFNSIAEVKVRYELMPRLYLQAISGVAQAVDLFYQFKIETGKK